MSHLFVCFVALVIQGVVCILFSLSFIWRDKMAVAKKPRVDFGLEFERNGFEEHFISTEGSSKPIRDDQVIRVTGDGLFFELNI